MSNRKNYNSMVFLTTLGVYLGLVLAGGAVAPSVLVHAATTRDFNVKNEIVVEDDLENKPDEETLDLSKSADVYFGEVGNLLKDLLKLHQIEKFDLSKGKFNFVEVMSSPCKTSAFNIPRTITDENLGNRWVELVIAESKDGFEKWNSLSDCVKDVQTKGYVSKDFGIKFILDDAELKVEASVYKTSIPNAEKIAKDFTQVFQTYKIDEKDKVVKKLHENTTVNSQKSQVFIVTRLPRAALNDLLAKKDAQ